MAEEGPPRKVVDPRFAIHFSKPCYQIYVGGLPYSATEEHVRDHFGKLGLVVSVIIPINRSGQTTGSAFVSYAKESEAKRAIQEFNRTEFHGRTIFVEEKKDRERARAEPRPRDDNRSHERERGNRWPSDRRAPPDDRRDDRRPPPDDRRDRFHEERQPPDDWRDRDRYRDDRSRGDEYRLRDRYDQHGDPGRRDDRYDRDRPRDDRGSDRRFRD